MGLKECQDLEIVVLVVVEVAYVLGAGAAPVLGLKECQDLELQIWSSVAVTASEGAPFPVICAGGMFALCPWCLTERMPALPGLRAYVAMCHAYGLTEDCPKVVHLFLRR